MTEARQIQGRTTIVLNRAAPPQVDTHKVQTHTVELPYPADLYTQATDAASVATLADITDAMIAEYPDKGYIVVEKAFAADRIASAGQALDDLMSGAVPDFKGAQFEPCAEATGDKLRGQERLAVTRKLHNFCAFHASLAGIRDDPALMDVVTRIIGEPPRLQQEMALAKPARIGSEKPWHQDHAYFELPLDTPCVGVWIALDRATRENGCMHLMPQLYTRKPTAMWHHNVRDWQICDSDMQGQPCVCVPLEPGGCLIWTSLMPHGTPMNTSDSRRRALQFHYVPLAVAVDPDAGHRAANFSGAEHDVEC